MKFILTIANDKGESLASYELEQGSSKKGTYTTISGKSGNKVIPFGKLYVDPSHMVDKELKQIKKALTPKTK